MLIPFQQVFHSSNIMAENPRRKSSILGKIKDKLRKKSSSIAGSSDGSQNSDRIDDSSGQVNGIVQIKETDIMLSALICHRPSATDLSNKLVPDSELESELKIAFAHYSKVNVFVPFMGCCPVDKVHLV